MNSVIKEAILSSQRCQRNWDLSKKIPKEDLKLFEVAVTQCPSKQNRVFYQVVFITDRDCIEHIHKTTKSRVIETSNTPNERVSNPQTLANCLAVFLRDRDYSEGSRTEYELKLGLIEGKTNSINPAAKVDEDRSVGIASGYLALVANLLGYKTGFYNAKHNNFITEKMFKTEVLLMVGIGYEDKNRNRREHHYDPSKVYPSENKNIKILNEINFINQILEVDVEE